MRLIMTLRYRQFIHHLPTLRYPCQHLVSPRGSEPTAFEIYVHNTWVDDQLVELSLWDTASE